MRRRPSPCAPRRARRRLALPADLRAGLVWAAIGLAAIGFFAFALPRIDDFRSGLWAMTPDRRVTAVIDGDTVDLRCTGRGSFRARIVGYDAPERFSPACAAEAEAARRATNVLRTSVLFATFTEVAFLGTDRYGRTLVDMRLNGERIAGSMVATGNGRRYFAGFGRAGWC